MIEEADEDVFENGVTINGMADFDERQIRSFLRRVEDFTMKPNGDLDLSFLSLICYHAPLADSPEIANELLVFIGRLSSKYPDVLFNDLIRKILDQIHEAASRSDKTSKPPH